MSKYDVDKIRKRMKEKDSLVQYQAVSNHLLIVQLQLEKMLGKLQKNLVVKVLINFHHILNLVTKVPVLFHQDVATMVVHHMEHINLHLLMVHYKDTYRIQNTVKNSTD